MSIIISELAIDLSNFDSEILITAALLSLAIGLSPSVLGSKLLYPSALDANLLFWKYPIPSNLIADACKQALGLNLCQLKV